MIENSECTRSVGLVCGGSVVHWPPLECINSTSVKKKENGVVEFINANSKIFQDVEIK